MMGSSDSVCYERPRINTKQNLEKFTLNKQNLGSQFCKLYERRLEVFKPRLLKSAKAKWSQHNPVFAFNIGEIENNVLCCIIGTVVLKVRLKNTALKSIYKNDWPFTKYESDKCRSDDDEIYLEDETARICISKNNIFMNIPTGVNIAALGIETQYGSFELMDICFVDPLINPLPELCVNIPNEEDQKYIAFISGLNISQDSYPEKIHDFIDFLSGISGNEDVCSTHWSLLTVKIQKFSSSIIRVINVGNNFAPPKNILKDARDVMLSSRKYLANMDRVKAFDTMDSLIFQMCLTVPVDIIPGETDPTNPMLPQQPLKRELFPKSMKLESLNLLTNPAEFELQGLSILGTSGQNLSDIYKFVSSEDFIEIAENTLIWSHLAPTAPDSLCCYPETKEDKLVIDTWPNIYFIGNQKKYDTKLIEVNGSKCRIVLIPEFKKTGTVVLVNINTLEPKLMIFE